MLEKILIVEDDQFLREFYAELLQGEGYVGIIVSTGGFSPDALSEIRRASKHIEAIDLERFIDMWEEHYNKLSDEDKDLLPLRNISFLAPEE